MQEINNKRASMLYLSDAIRGELQTDKFNVIKAPCGSGKSYYAVNVLPNKVLGENPPLHRVLYLIETTNGRDGIIQSYPDKARGYDEMIDKNQNFAFVDCEKNKIVVITYAKFGSLIKRNMDFAKNFRLIIADEFHNIYWPIPAERQQLWNAYPLFSSKSIEIMLEENCLNLAAMKALLCAARNKDIMTVGISATPEDAPGWREWADMPFNDICIAENVRHYMQTYFEVNGLTDGAAKLKEMRENKETHINKNGRTVRTYNMGKIRQWFMENYSVGYKKYVESKKAASKAVEMPTNNVEKEEKTAA